MDYICPTCNVEMRMNKVNSIQCPECKQEISPIIYKFVFDMIKRSMRNAEDYVDYELYGHEDWGDR